MRRLLFVRMDRIGDLVMTLPADQHPELQSSEVVWFLSRGLEFVANHACPQRQCEYWKKEFSLGQFLSVLNRMRRLNPDVILVFHAPWWIGLAAFLARIRLRAGVRSQWHSLLFFNRGIRQKRSEALKSEMEYNFDLVHHVLNLQSSYPRPSYLSLTAPEKSDVLRKFNLQKKNYYVVHPGMAGSARNWSAGHYASLIQDLIHREKCVVVTGTAIDAEIILEIKNHLGPLVSSVRWLNSVLEGEDLLKVLADAQAVLAPSTGVAHLAAALGTPTLGLYSPVRVQKALRWGPQGPRTKTLTPQVECPGTLNCLGASCAKYDCMQEVRPELVRDALLAF